MTVEANGELKMLIMVPATNTHYSVYLFSRHLSSFYADPGVPAYSTVYVF